MGGAAPDLQVSKSGWRLCWAQHPRRKCLGAIGVREPCTFKASQAWGSQNWEVPEISSHSTRRLRVELETSLRLGLEVPAGRAVSRGLCTQNLRPVFLPFKDTHCQLLIAFFFCLILPLFWVLVRRKTLKSSLPLSVHACPYFAFTGVSSLLTYYSSFKSLWDLSFNLCPYFCSLCCLSFFLNYS